MRTEERTERHDEVKGRFSQNCEKTSKVSVFTHRGLGRLPLEKPLIDRYIGMWVVLIVKIARYT